MDFVSDSDSSGSGSDSSFFNEFFDDTDEMDEISSPDDEYEIQIGTRLHPRNENFYGDAVPKLNNAEFMDHFRVSRRLVTQLTQQYRQSTYYTHQSGPYGKVDAEEQLLMFLWFAGHEAASHTDVADRFDVAKSELNKILDRLTLFISRLGPSVIRWPTPEEMEASEAYFSSKGLPGAVGAIDGSHVEIDRPATDHVSYFDRKHKYSLQLQVVCDHQLRIIDLYAGEPGSVHDARVFRRSPLSGTLQAKCRQRYILGDSAYPCLRHLITPYRDRGNLSATHKRFNNIHSRGRVVVEHCFGQLKQKWRALYHLKQRDISHMVHFIRACCVLHNLSLNESLVDLPYEPPVDPSHVLPGEGDVSNNDEPDDPDGQAFRDRLRLGRF